MQDIMGKLERLGNNILNDKLRELEPGLIKLQYSYMEHPQEELALIMTPPFIGAVGLPNNTLHYRPFLRSAMRAVDKGLHPIGPFLGLKVHDKYIESVNGRVVQLNDSFCDTESNFNPTLIACNNDYYTRAISELKNVLHAEGFDLDSSCWEDYKTWELERLKGF